MKAKQLKDYLNLYNDDKELIIKLPSGNVWEIDDILLNHQILTDKKREVCKLYLK